VFVSSLLQLVENVFANTLLFGDDGDFNGFGKTEPTS
jgi:hypothetical protein